MQGMLRKWSPRDKYFKYQNFPIQVAQEWEKFPKGKRKPALKWKDRKMCWKPRQRIDRQLSQLRFKAIVNVFVSRPVTSMSSGKPRFELYVWQILFWRDSCVQNMEAWSLASTSRFHRRFSLFLTEWYSFFPLRTCFFFFFYWGKIKKRKYANNMKNEPRDERLPRKFHQGSRSGTRLWHLPDSLTSGAFGGF